MLNENDISAIADDGPVQVFDGADSIDRELEAAIEYKIAASGMDGAALVLELLDGAIRRRRRG